MTHPTVSTDRLVIRSSLSQLDRVARFSLALAAKGSLVSTDAYRLRLAVDELVTNIITHGYRKKPGKIALNGGVSDCEVRVQVEDWAPRFDPKTEVPHRVPLENRGSEFGGFGLFLVFQAVDGFEYEFSDGVNRSILVVHPRKA